MSEGPMAESGKALAFLPPAFTFSPTTLMTSKDQIPLSASPPSTSPALSASEKFELNEFDSMARRIKINPLYYFISPKAFQDRQLNQLPEDPLINKTLFMESIKQVLALIPILSSRLIYPSTGHNPYLLLNDQGIAYTEAQSNFIVSKALRITKINNNNDNNDKKKENSPGDVFLIESSSSFILSRLTLCSLSVPGAVIENGDSPLFSIQLTHFACGSTILSFNIIHELVDAEGLFTIIKLISNKYNLLFYKYYTQTNKINTDDLFGGHHNKPINKENVIKKSGLKEIEQLQSNHFHFDRKVLNRLFSSDSSVNPLSSLSSSRSPCDCLEYVPTSALTNFHDSLLPKEPHLSLKEISLNENREKAESDLTSLSQVVKAFLYISSSHQALLKEKVTEAIKADPSMINQNHSATFVSTLDCVQALFWYLVMKAQIEDDEKNSADSDEKVKFITIINGRKRIEIDPIKEGFIGNIWAYSRSLFSVKDMKCNENVYNLLGRMGLALREGINKNGNFSYFHKIAKWMNNRPLSEQSTVTGDSWSNRSFMTTSWAKLGAYQASFGFHTQPQAEDNQNKIHFIYPSAVEPGIVGVKGFSVILDAASNDDGGLNITFMLDKKSMNRLAKDPLVNLYSKFVFTQDE